MNKFTKHYSTLLISASEAYKCAYYDEWIQAARSPVMLCAEAVSRAEVSLAGIMIQRRWSRCRRSPSRLTNGDGCSAAQEPLTILQHPRSSPAPSCLALLLILSIYARYLLSLEKWCLSYSRNKFQIRSGH